jgi:hypothetical protein
MFYVLYPFVTYLLTLPHININYNVYLMLQFKNIIILIFNQSLIELSADLEILYRNLEEVRCNSGQGVVCP